MATFFYKWFLLLALPFARLGDPSPIVHPLHVSTVEIEHNAAEKTLEISCRIFTDDFETVLAKLYKTKTDFSNTALKATMDDLVKKYISTHLQVKTDGNVQSLHVLGWEKESEAIYVYVSAPSVTTVKKAEITDTILHDIFDDQMNIVHVIVGGSRKSTKLNYPDKVAAFSW